MEFRWSEWITDAGRAVRQAVFVREQAISPALEYEGDEQARHLTVYDGDRAVAAGRIVLDGDTALLGRIAVLPAYRGQGLGRRTVEEMMRHAAALGASRLTVHAQTRAAGFYQRLGFVVCGAEYAEAGIPHLPMEHPALYTHVIWDWNGTLLDDLDWSVQVLNGMLSRRKMKNVDGTDGYHAVFGFPVRDYYRRVGFDFDIEPYEVTASEYVAHYYGGWQEHCALADGAAEMLSALRAAGVHQVLLSASRQDLLEGQVRQFPAMSCMERIIGISDYYASGKIEEGRRYLAGEHCPHALVIGDTAHDAQVARAMDCDCLLVAGGHQSRETLERCGVPVAGDLREALQWIRPRIAFTF